MRNLRSRLVLFEIIGDQGRALIGTRRAAERIWRRDDQENAPVFHALELLAQQPRLRPRVPGMRHGFRGDLVIALNGAIFEGDARRNDQAVIE